PLVLLIFLYNLKSQEAELGFLALLEVQAGSTTRWLLCRVLFYVGLLWAVIVLLLLYGALLTPVMTLAPKAFAAMVLYSTLYLLFWTLNYFMILKKGTGIMGNALKMVGMWLIVAFVIPAAVHQWVSIQKPVEFMTEFIDAQRDQLWKLYDLPDSVKQAKVDALFPDIVESPVAGDSTRLAAAYRTSMPAVANELRKKPLVSIEADNASKNALVRASYPINPVAFFQNRFNRIAHTHYDDYALYRHHIQSLIDKQISTMVLDTWQDVTVDKQRFLEYQEFLSQP
ncbi:MAG: hypothetical protein AAGB22_15675, partial [Bacteroidota bacterium]